MIVVQPWTAVQWQAEPMPATPSTLPRLLYVEDEPAAAAIAVEVLAEDYLVQHAPDGEQALEFALRQRFDAMVIDRRLPGMSGTDLVRAIRRAGITTPVVLLTALGTVADKVQGLDDGANDYLVKPFDFAELTARLRALRRAFTAGGARRELGGWSFVPDNRVLFSPRGSRIALTEAENDLLELLSSSPEHVFGRDEILEAVFPGGESAGTVEAYVSYVRRKTVPELIETVRGQGYRIGRPW